MDEPAQDEQTARHFVERASGRLPDLLLIIPLRGLSAQAIEAAGWASPAA